MLLEGLETLQALLEHGTMSKVSSKLHISPSAVSKRIDKLESSLKQSLIQHKGRRVVLTPYALKLLNELTPALNQIQTTLSEQLAETDDGVIEISCGESLLVAFLAPVFKRLLKEDPNLRIRTSHTPDTIEQIQSGKALLGINTGMSSDYPDLIFEHIKDESFCLYPVKQENQMTDANEPRIQQIICIDLSFPSNRHLIPELARCGLHPIMQMESYMAIIESAKAGLAAALIPECLAKHFALDPDQMQQLDIQRPFYLCYRKSALKRPRFQRLLKAVRLSLQGG